MAFRMPSMSEVNADRVRRAKSMIDLVRPGALEAFRALPPDPSPEALEALAAQYPVRALGFTAAPANARVQNALAILTKGMDKAAWQIRLASEDLGYEDPHRISFGCAALDYITHGGMGRGTVTQVKGPEARGKTFALIKATAYTLANGGAVAWAAGERFNASWARRLGVPIVIPPHELELMDSDRREAAEAYNASVREAAARFIIITAKLGNEVLDRVVKAVETNAFDLICVDSIAVLRKAGHLKKDVGDETVAGEAKMINDFCSRCESAFNFVEGQRGRELDDDSGDVGAEARTAVAVINQLRDQGIGSFIARRPDAGGGWGLKYAKSVDIEFMAYEDVQGDVGGTPTTIARRAQVVCTKNKIGTPGRKAVVEMALVDIPGQQVAGTYNPYIDLCGGKFRDEVVRGLAEMAGVVRRVNAQTYAIGDLKFRGKAQLESYLLDPNNAHVMSAIQRQVHAWIADGCPIVEGA